MAFTFPSNPTLNQTYTYNSITWTYNGRGWSRSTFPSASSVITVTPANVSDQTNTSTGYFSIPKGTTAERPGTPTTGMIRYNSTLGIVEQYNGTAWAAVGGAVIPSAVSDQQNTSTGYFNLPAGTTAQRPATAYAGATRLNTTTNYVEIYANGAWTNLMYVGVITATYTGNPTIATASGYTTATFTSAGTFTVTALPTGGALELLVVAGGGGGGLCMGGGGGAGGLIYASTFTPTLNSAYTISIGAGGAGATSRSAKGGNGTNTTAFGYTAVGGGGGASWESGAGGSGGSGGGAPNGQGAGSGTSGQGNAGGGNATGVAGGGGGGAGAAATATSTSPGGAGYTVPNIGGTYAGGGGGGAGNGGYGSLTTGLGGSGGGGRGGLVSSAGTAGTANTGGGGGGGSYDGGDYVGGAGGSGVVIVRYRSS